MGYDFSRDVYGDFSAEPSICYEAQGYWLTHGLGARESYIRDVFVEIELLNSRQRFEYSLEGPEYNLILNRENASVRAHALDSVWG